MTHIYWILFFFINEKHQALCNDLMPNDHRDIVQQCVPGFHSYASFTPSRNFLLARIFKNAIPYCVQLECSNAQTIADFEFKDAY